MQNKTVTKKKAVKKVANKASAKKAVTVTQKNVKKVIGGAKKAVSKSVARRTAIQKEKEKEKQYKLDFELNGEKTTVEGDTVIECLAQLKPAFYKTKAVFVFYFNGKTCRRVLMPFAVKRILAVRFDQEVFQNRINKLFK